MLNKIKEVTVGYFSIEEETEIEKDNKVYKDVFNNNKAYFFNKEDWNETVVDLAKYTDIEVEEFINSDDTNLRQHFQPITTKDGVRYTMSRRDIDSSKEVDVIDNGFYNIGYTDDVGYFLYEQNVSTGDKYIELGQHLDKIKDSVSSFRDNKSIYDENGLKYKKGILLYGPAGNGKTQNLREIVKNYISNSVIIFVDTQFPQSLIKNLKNFKSNYIFIFEEFTQLLTGEDQIAKLLLFLDGELSLDNQLVLATTNYPEALPANLVSRPGRFDDLIEIGDPDKETRKMYLEGLGVEVTEQLLNDTNKFSIAYLREVFLSSKLSGLKIEEQIKINKDRMKLVKKQFDTNVESIGF